MSPHRCMTRPFCRRIHSRANSAPTVSTRSSGRERRTLGRIRTRLLPEAEEQGVKCCFDAERGIVWHREKASTA